MLLLILFSGILSLCAAQTAPPTSLPSATLGTSTMTTGPYSHLIQTTTVLPTADSAESVLAFLQAAIQSNLELNETTLAPILNKLQEIIQQLQPHVPFTLTVKNITEV